MAAYFNIFRTAAASASLQGNEEVDERYDVAREFITVTYQMRHQPFCQGINVRPSECFLSSLSNPVGSLVIGTLECLRDHHQMRHQSGGGK